MAESGIIKPDTYNANKYRSFNKKIRDRLAKDIKDKNFCGIYLLHGEDDYLRKSYLNALKKAIAGDDEMNVSHFCGEDVNVSEIVSIASTMPFFAEKRLIIIENSNLFVLKGNSVRPESEELEAFIPDIPDSTIFIFSEPKIDGRLKLYKSVIKKGALNAELKHLSEDELYIWCAKRLAAENIKITSDAAKELVDRVGIDMFTLSNELKKLIAYKGNGTVITADDIRAVSQVKFEDAIFDLLDYAVSGNINKTMEIYSDLLALREPPLKIIVLLGRQCANLLAIKDEDPHVITENELSAKTGLSPNNIKRARPLARKCSREKLKRGLDMCIEYDDMIKSGDMEDSLAAELLLLYLVSDKK